MEAIFGELLREKKSPKDGKPDTPAKHLRNFLDIHDPKHKDKLVEDEIPELVPHVLVFTSLERTKHKGVNRLGQ